MKPVDLTHLQGLGNEISPYQLTSCEDWDLLRQYVNQGGETTSIYFELLADLDFATFKPAGYTGESNYVPIGGADMSCDETYLAFRGHLEGHHHRICHVNLVETPTPDCPYFGLFRVIEGATIQHLTLQQLHLTLPSAQTLVNAKCQHEGIGVLVGLAQHATLEGIRLEQLVLSNASGLAIGGLVGVLCHSVVSFCQGVARFTAHSETPLGGLVGDACESHLNDNVMTVDLQGTREIGGLVGFAKQTTFSYNHVQGHIRGQRLMGGLAGELREGTFFSNSVNLTSIAHHETGGLVGVAQELRCIENQVVVELEGYTYLGGISGYASHAFIQDNVVLAKIKGHQTIGGLTGYLYHGTLSQSTVSGTLCGRKEVGGLVGTLSNTALHLHNCLSAVELIAEEEVAGLVGACVVPSKLFQVTWDIQDCLVVGVNHAYDWGSALIGTEIPPQVQTDIRAYWDFDATRQVTTYGEGEGVTHCQLIGDEARQTLPHFDFNTIWRVVPHAYPVLQSTLNL